MTNRNAITAKLSAVLLLVVLVFKSKKVKE